MKYSTYWSILDTPSQSLQSNLICLYFAIGAALLWLFIKKVKKESVGGDQAVLLWMTGAFSIIGFSAFVILSFFVPDKSNEMTLEMLNSPNTPRVEGIVSNFERTFRDGKETIERFKVEGVPFAYGDALFGKFNSFTQTYNDVIFNGQHVRITYKFGSNYGDDYNSILKLELVK